MRWGWLNDHNELWVNYPFNFHCDVTLHLRCVIFDALPVIFRARSNLAPACHHDTLQNPPKICPFGSWVHNCPPAAAEPHFLGSTRTKAVKKKENSQNVNQLPSQTFRQNKIHKQGSLLTASLIMFIRNPFRLTVMWTLEIIERHLSYVWRFMPEASSAPDIKINSQCEPHPSASLHESPLIPTWVFYVRIGCVDVINTKTAIQAPTSRKWINWFWQCNPFKNWTLATCWEIQHIRCEWKPGSDVI